MSGAAARTGKFIENRRTINNRTRGFMDGKTHPQIIESVGNLEMHKGRSRTIESP